MSDEPGIGQGAHVEARIEPKGVRTDDARPDAPGEARTDTRGGARTDGRNQPRIVIVGGGFGGLYAARALRRAPARVTVVDQHNYHLFQPLLYQVATAGLNPSDIAAPIRHVLRRQANTDVVLGEAVAVDTARRVLRLADAEIAFDYLILAAGATHSYFNHPEWEKVAPGLKTIEDAVEIRRRVLLAFEAAERESDPARREAWMTFVIVGGGPTGVELAGAFAEIARNTLRGDFRHIDPSRAHVILLEGQERILPAYVPSLSASAKRQLEHLGVDVRLNAKVTGIDEEGVSANVSAGASPSVSAGGSPNVLAGASRSVSAGADLAGANGVRIAARNTVWAAGVAASPLAASLGVPLDRAGRVLVEPDLTVPGHPEIYVVGDLAALMQDGQLVPGVAPAAIQEGPHAARNILATIRGKPRKPFRYWDKGSLATIGRSAAIAQVGRIHLGGFVAWMAWLLIHILFLIGFRNRFLVIFSWAWSYATYQRGARLITGPNATRLLAPPTVGAAAPARDDVPRPRAMPPS